MKNTCFLAMLAATLLGGGSAAAGTGYSATPGSDASNPPDYVFGAYSIESALSGGALLIFADDNPELEDVIEHAYGGYVASGGNCENCTVSMTGGTVNYLHGGYSHDGNASNNTVIVTGGSASWIAGGYVAFGSGSLADNQVVVTGGSFGQLYGAFADGGDYIGNSVHLVGTGASITVNGVKYDGHALKADSVSATADPTDSFTTGNNSIDIYGTDITVGSIQTYFTTILNFHVNDGLLDSQKPMITLASEFVFLIPPLDLSGVTLNINADAVENWSAFQGETISLLVAAKPIKGLENPVVLDVTKNGEVIDKVTLQLAQDGMSLLMGPSTDPVPEPTTGTLSLLALAGLAARRRKK